MNLRGKKQIGGFPDFRIAGIQVIVVYVKITKVMLISKNELSLYG